MALKPGERRRTSRVGCRLVDLRAQHGGNSSLRHRRDLPRQQHALRGQAELRLLLLVEPTRDRGPQLCPSADGVHPSPPPPPDVGDIDLSAQYVKVFSEFQLAHGLRCN